MAARPLLRTTRSLRR